MSSAQEVEGGLVSVLFPEKKGGEMGLPKCVHFHVANSTMHHVECVQQGGRYWYGSVDTFAAFFEAFNDDDLVGKVH